MSDITLSTAEAADLLGVHPSTAKRWLDESASGVDRTEGGHRRVGLSELLALAEHKGGSTFLAPFTPFEAHAWQAIREEETSANGVAFTELAVGWLLYADPRRIGLLFETLARRARLPFERLIDGPLTHFMHAVGDAWRQGRLRVADEHLVTQMLLESLIRVGSRWSEPMALRADAPQSVVACAEGNLHQLGALSVRLTLERFGWRAWYLGPDVPVAEVLSAQQSQDASLVCIAFGASQCQADVLRCLDATERMLSERPASFRVVLGGPPCTPEVIAGRAHPFASLDCLSSMQALADWLGEHHGEGR
ncbi:MAG: B12-binding domain-containing protein [Gemmatimonadota bacterium]